MVPLMKYTFLHEYETKQALAEFILRTDRLSMGAQCAAFEKAFAAYQETKHALLYNSGGSANLALIQALLNLGRLKKGDRVGFSALTWSTNVMPLIQLGLEPVPVDCEIATLNVSPNSLLSCLNQGPLAALFITNALGLTDDLLGIKRVCDERGILLIEDNCESLGTMVGSTKTGNVGLASTFSFFVAHHMSTIEGGMCCTDDAELAEMLCIVRANGWDRNLSVGQQIALRTKHKVESEFTAKYTFYDLAYNLRPTDVTGFLGLFQMKFLEESIVQREKNFLRIHESLQQNPDFIPLETRHVTRCSAFAIPVICKTEALRNKYAEQFSGAGVEIRPMIAGNIQNQPFYTRYVGSRYVLPCSDFLHKNSFYCGNYPELSTSDIETIVGCLHKYDL